MLDELVQDLLYLHPGCVVQLPVHVSILRRVKIHAGVLGRPRFGVPLQSHDETFFELDLHVLFELAGVAVCDDKTPAGINEHGFLHDPADVRVCLADPQYHKVLTQPDRQVGFEVLHAQCVELDIVVEGVAPGVLGVKYLELLVRRGLRFVVDVAEVAVILLFEFVEPGGH